MKLFFLLISLGFTIHSSAQEFIPLWPEGKKPNSNNAKIKDSLADDRI